MAKIAVIEATGTAGSRVTAKLKGRDIPVAEISRSLDIEESLATAAWNVLGACTSQHVQGWCC